MIAKAILLAVVQPPPLGCPSKESALAALSAPAGPARFGSLGHSVSWVWAPVSASHSPCREARGAASRPESRLGS